MSDEPQTPEEPIIPVAIHGFDDVDDDYQIDPILARKEHMILSVMNLSGTQIEVGYLKGVANDSIYFKTPENPEPVYISVPEAELLMAALALARFEVMGEPGYGG